jgi:hypothetical protein
MLLKSSAQQQHFRHFPTCSLELFTFALRICITRVVLNASEGQVAVADLYDEIALESLVCATAYYFSNLADLS